MKESGLDNRHRDKVSPKTGEIQQKRGDTLNKNLPKPIREFSPNAKLSTMRKETRAISHRPAPVQDVPTGEVPGWEVIGVSGDAVLSSAAGRKTRNDEPAPGELRTSMKPLQLRTMP